MLPRVRFISLIPNYGNVEWNRKVERARKKK